MEFEKTRMVRKMRVRPGILLVVFLFFFTLAYPLLSRSAGFYMETGLGLSQIKSSSEFYGATVSSSPTMGFGGNLTFGQDFSHSASAMHFHLGLRTQYSTSSDGSNGLNLIVPTPYLRFELPRFYFGFGLTPFVFGKYADQNYSLSDGALAGFGEVGLLWRVVSYFHLALEGSMFYVKSGSGFSPAPVMAVSLQMRFMFTNEDRGRGGHGDWDGWRYPFGIRK